MVIGGPGRISPAARGGGMFDKEGAFIDACLLAPFFAFDRGTVRVALAAAVAAAAVAAAALSAAAFSSATFLATASCASRSCRS